MSFELTDRQCMAINSADQESELVGHDFAKLVDGRIEEVTLTSIQPDGTIDSYYSPVSKAHFYWLYEEGVDCVVEAKTPFATLCAHGSRVA